MRYRRKVMMENLRNSFPEKNEKELKRIAKRSILNLAEQMVNIVSLAGITSKQRRKLLRFPDVDTYIKTVADSDIVLMGGHVGCWEYFSTVACYDASHKLLSVYHPLQSSTQDHLIKRLRRCENTELVPREDSLLHFIRQRGKEQKLILGLIADQSPFWYRDARWITFFNQDTMFANGGEQIARKYSLPVVLLHMKRLRRGEYELHFEQLYDGKEPVQEHEITERYAHRLEAIIRECPEMWLWTHRRWKHKRV
jgi:KDO2-lipid IV(A) lauroyltransferase